MIKVTVLYPNKPGSRFDVDYYLNVHMPLSIRLLGLALKGVSVEIGLSGATPGSTPPYAAMVGFTCESVQDFAEAIAPHNAELKADVLNYTDIQPEFQISEIRILQ
jgi:uncharacterized protein (TIGR02118 family)